MKRLAVLMRWLSATEAYVSVGRMVYVFLTYAAVLVVRGNDDVADPVLVRDRLEVGIAHCIFVAGAVTLRVVTLQKDVREENALYRPVLEARGISSRVFAIESIYVSYVALEVNSAVFSWLTGLMPTSLPMTELHF